MIPPKHQIHLIVRSLALSIILFTSACYAQQPYYDVTPGNGYGIRLWQPDDSYKIHMGYGSEYFYGPVNDYSIKTNMSSGYLGRGWTWGVMGQVPVAAINIQGNMQIAGSFSSAGNIGAGLNAGANTGYGSSFSLLGASNNTDALWLCRFNKGENASHLRVNIGDDNLGDDALDVGITYNADGLWRSLFTVVNNGNVGIGTTIPSRKFHVAGAGEVAGRIESTNGEYASLEFASNNKTWQWSKRPATEGDAFQLFYNNGTSWGSPQFTATTNGNIGIGTSSPNQKLTVNGTIYGKEVKVDLNVPGPDYVFEKTYELPALEAVKSYIDQHKHLPEVPSAREMETNGINLSEMNMLLLKKVEELTLHLIKQNETIERLNERIGDLEQTKK